jgi:nucleoid-associated protein YgaU
MMVKASLREEKNPFSLLDFHFNPTTLSFQKQVKFKREPNQSSREDPPVQFEGVDPTTLRLQLLFDAVGSVSLNGIQPEIDKLVSWTTVPPSADSQSAAPPRLVFSWGRLSINGKENFRGYLEDLKVTIEMFDRQGVPLRATVDLTLKSASDPPAGTNPTSGTERSRQRYLVKPGQTLHGIAFTELGDASAWRAIAELNRLDDPSRLRPGIEVLLPDRTELSPSHR